MIRFNRLIYCIEIFLLSNTHFVTSQDVVGEPENLSVLLSDSELSKPVITLDQPPKPEPQTFERSPGVQPLIEATVSVLVQEQKPLIEETPLVVQTPDEPPILTLEGPPNQIPFVEVIAESQGPELLEFQIPDEPPILVLDKPLESGKPERRCIVPSVEDEISAVTYSCMNATGHDTGNKCTCREDTYLNDGTDDCAEFGTLCRDGAFGILGIPLSLPEPIALPSVVSLPNAAADTNSVTTTESTSGSIGSSNSNCDVPCPESAAGFLYCVIEHNRRIRRRTGATLEYELCVPPNAQPPSNSQCGHCVPAHRHNNNDHTNKSRKRTYHLHSTENDDTNSHQTHSIRMRSGKKSQHAPKHKSGKKARREN